VPRVRGRRLLAWGVAVAILAALLVVGLSGKRASGKPAPALPRERLAGPPATLASLLATAHGRPALVTFWASWCGPCAGEAPALERFAHSAAGRGRLVAVDWNDGLSGARAFVDRYRWTFPTLRDAEGTVGEAYGLTGLPTTFVIDAHGRIRGALRGPQTTQTLDRALSMTSS
jgi:cytochrome c biogenesis protein CcmG, thiol:disulfide interchange protein DsbE